MTPKIGLSLCPEAGRWKDTVDQARKARDLGFDSVWLPEHHLMAGYQPAPMLGLAGLVEVSGDMLLGTDIVVAPFHHPVRIAEDASVIQDMSSGRFVLGLGLGYRREEFSAFGVEYRHRAQIFDEQLRVIRSLLTTEDVSFHGEHFKLDDVTIYPRPAPPPPIWVGGWVDAAVKRAAYLADAWFPGPTADVAKVASCLRTYDTELEAAGRRRAELPIFREVWVADSASLLEHGQRALERMYADDYVSWNHQNIDRRSDIALDRFIVGTPDEVAAALVDLHATLGYTHLVARLHFHGIEQDAVLESMRLLAEQVRPAVEEALG